jgi:hypothetical protein
MSKILSRTTAIIMFGLAAMGSANARALNHNQLYPGYAGEVYRQRRLRISCPDEPLSTTPVTCQRARAQTTSASPTESQEKGSASPFSPHRFEE